MTQGMTYPDGHPDGLAVADPFGLGYPVTVPPRYTIAAGSIVAVNRRYFLRWVGGPFRIDTVATDIGASSGNVAFGLYANNGAGRSAVPSGAPIVSTGIVASPGTGYRTFSLGGSYVVHPGSWVSVWADNTTVTFRVLASGALDSNLALGDCFYDASVTDPTTAPGSLVAATGRPFCIIGLPA